MDTDTGRSSEQRRREQTGALVVGFLALAAALAIARWRPATGYELSIYAATPTTYWLGAIVATVVAVLVAATAEGRRRDAAHLLAGMAVLSVLALPAIRGYAFYGSGDAMTHLGWARDTYVGDYSPFENLYPGLHLVSIAVSEVVGTSIRRALVLLPVLLFPLVFVVFVALTTGVITTGRFAVTLGLLSALLFVPMNLVSNHPIAHPSTQTLFFVPLVLYLLFRYLEVPDEYGALTAPSGAAVALAGLATIVYHPQEAMNLLALLVSMAALQAVLRRYRPEHPIAGHRRVTAHALVLGATFVVWTGRQDRAQGRVAYVLRSFLDTGATTVESTGSRAASLAELGGSLEIVFLKLFGVTTIFGLLAIVVVLASLRGSLYRSGSTYASLVTYLGVGLLPIGAVFVVVFLADQGDHYFRFFGFMLVPITILGAVGLSLGADRLEGKLGPAATALAIVLAFALLLPAQALVFHHGPYVYQDNQQVTEAAFEGNENAFEYREEDVVFTGMRGGPERFVHVVYGAHTARTELEFPGTNLPGPVFNANLTSHYEEDRYLLLSDADHAREIVLYDGLRYRQSGYRTLRTDPAVDRLQTNGDVELYRIEGTDD